MIYEALFILRPELEDSEIAEFNTQIKKYISSFEGEILKEKQARKQKFAYPIKKCTFGYFMELIFDFSSENVEKLIEKIKFDKNILRYIIVKTEKKLEEKNNVFETKFSSNQKEEIEKVEEEEKIIYDDLEKESEEISTEEEMKKDEEEKTVEIEEEEEEEEEKEEKEEEKKEKEKRKKIKEDKIKIEELDKKLEEILEGEI